MWDPTIIDISVKLSPLPFLSSLGNINLSLWVAKGDFFQQDTQIHHFLWTLLQN